MSPTRSFGVKINRARAPTLRRNVRTAGSQRLAPSPLRLRAPTIAPLGLQRMNVSVRPRASPPKTRMFVIYGFTCDLTKNTLRRRALELQGIANASKRRAIEVSVHCNEKTSTNMPKNIARRVIWPKRPLSNTPFVVQMRAAVCKALQNGERVVLVGHSYGGSVAVRIAESVEHMCGPVPAHRLSIATFGSIYTRSPRSISSRVHLRQYAYANDIAKMCHRRNVRSCPFITELPPTGTNGVRSHMAYGSYIERIARTGSVDL